MVLAANLLMVVLAAALIGYPFLAKHRRNDVLPENSKSGLDRKEILFSALGEIEFDYKMNKINDEDYRELKAGYQREALKVLDREEEALDAEIDSLVAKRRPGRTKKALGDDEAHE